MRICVFGTGAIGALVLARFAAAGLDATGVARGETLAAIRARGIRITDGNGAMTEEVQPVVVTDDPASLGPQNVLVIALKAHAVADALDAMAPLIGADTVVVPAVNGIPWWYFHGLPGDWPSRHLESVDPGGRIWHALGVERTVGCVVYLGASVPRPGVVKRTKHDNFAIGEPNGENGERARTVAGIFETAGFTAPVVPDIRAVVWNKIWGNAWANPISALTRATTDLMCGDPVLRQPLIALMAEIRAVAGRFGIDLADEIEARIDASATLGAFKSSTLQDLERGRTIELDAIVGSISEMGRMVGEPTPNIDMVYALTRLAARIAGCYQASRQEA